MPEIQRLLSNGTWTVPFALLLSLGLTGLVIVLANRNGWVVRPKADRWSQQTTALFGGVAIFLAFALGCIPLLSALVQSHHYDLLGLLAGGAIIFAFGLRDDIRPLNPLVKLMGQVMAATPFVVGVALTYNSTIAIVSLPLTLFWMVLLSNSFNLLDNMDGLSAGTSAVVGSVLAVYCFLNGVAIVGVLSLLVTASCLGFLCFNFRPKKPAAIFMGDCASMFLGYMLAGLTVIGVCPKAINLPTAFVVPLLFMALPLFDTTLVIIMRKVENRPISQGGKDHCSHRLVYAGCTDKQAVLLLYGISLLFGAVAIGTASTNKPILLESIFLLGAMCLAWFGTYLARFNGTQQAAVDASRHSEKETISSP